MENKQPLPPIHGQQQAQTQGQPQPQIIYLQTAPTGPIIYQNYASKLSKALGITRIVIGILCALLNIIIIVLEENEHAGGGGKLGFGIWSGVFFAIAGGLGIGAAAKKTHCIIVAHMVLSIISSLLGFHLAGWMGMIATVAAIEYKAMATVALCCIMLLLGVIEGVCDIIAAVFCCKVVCCGAPPSTAQVAGTNIQYQYTVATTGSTNQGGR